MSENRSAALLEELRAGVNGLTTSEGWAEHLAVQAKFHHYSWGNCELIARQMPEASHVAGFHRWLELGRHVVKGSKALWVLAPMVVKDKATGDSEVKGFKAVPVFDISQTEGADLPADPCSLLRGDDNSAWVALSSVAGGLGFAVVDVDALPNDANGCCHHEPPTISVRTDREPAQRAKTLAHEIGHAILHGPKRDGMTRDLIELEAESIAYVVCSALGIRSDDYSFGYVAQWVGADKVDAALKTSATRIQKAADQILTTIGEMVTT